MNAKVSRLFNIYNQEYGSSFAGNVYDITGISPTIQTGQGGNRQPLIVSDMDNDITLKQIPHGFNYGFEYKDVCPTITTSSFEHNNFIIKKDMAQKTTINLPEELKGKKFRIRKLTPWECFRLMGVDDKDIDTLQAYPYHDLIEHPAYSKEERFARLTEKEKRAAMKESISNSSLYKLAGNSIVVDVLFHLFRKMFIETENESVQLSLF